MDDDSIFNTSSSSTTDSIFSSWTDSLSSSPSSPFVPSDNHDSDGSNHSDGNEEETFSSSVTTEDESYHCTWAKFNGQPPIPGFSKNVVAVFRESFTNGEETEEQLKAATCEALQINQDATGSEEVKFLREIFQYLMNNGTESVQVMSNYPVYVKTLIAELGDRTDEMGVEVLEPDGTNELPGPDGMGGTLSVMYDCCDVTVCLLLPCFGQLQQRKLCELVANAYKSSRVGVIIVGNASISKDHKIQDDCWKGFISYLRMQHGGGLNDYLELFCRQHNVVNRKIFSSIDLRTQSPSGGCDQVCGKMDCGHICLHRCHPIDRHHRTKEYRCQHPCQRVCPYGHKCDKTCWKNCGRCFFVVTLLKSCEHENGQARQLFCDQQSKVECRVPIKKRLPCGHFMETICSQKNETNIQCLQLLGTLLPCGHGITFRCWQNVGPKLLCQLPVWHEFKCGHGIMLKCGELAESGEKLRCNKRCRERMMCGHFCGQLCHTEDPKHEEFMCVMPCRKHCRRHCHQCKGQGEHLCSEPCPPCDEPFDFPLPCGHYVRIQCSDPDPDVENYYCRERCSKTLPFCRHKCLKLCGEPCGNCNLMVTLPAPGCKRGHMVRVPCSGSKPDKCKYKVLPRERPECGHDVRCYCYEAETVTKVELAEMCEAPCRDEFDGENQCGHSCEGKCRDCYQGRLHMRCKEPCGKPLICGHSCITPCPMVCPPCCQVCFNYCEHTKCEYECGVPCERNCEVPCPYKCEHSQCSKKCSEVCDKPLCNEPCPKLLECGHQCVGFCGEQCPPYCRVCTPEKLLEGIFSGNNELDPNDKFIYLPDCGHCVESTDLENWLKTGSDEILALRCPICRTRLSRIRRYSAVFHENYQLINSVRRKIFGNEQETERILQEVQGKIMGHLEKADKKQYFSMFAQLILEDIHLPRYRTPDLSWPYFRSMYIDLARFLNWAATEWINCSQTLMYFNKHLRPIHFEKLLGYWKEYMEMTGERIWPMHRNEVEALERERVRMDDVVAIYSRMDESKNPRLRKLVSNFEVTRLFLLAEQAVRVIKPYTLECRQQVRNHIQDLDAMLNCTIKLTEQEREQIVVAFGEGSGRWFKCPNGHVYVVTECGGATELGQCNECGENIGGENHVLVQKNYLASEMDGAALPLYPTVFDRNDD